MRHYETIFIISPELSEDETGTVVEKFSGILTDAGAVMVKVENWGRRRLAYEVKKFNKGYYVLFDYGAEPAAVTEMERNFKIDERVIRFLTVKQDDEFDPEAIKAAAEPEPEPESEEEEKPQDEAQAQEEAPAESAEEKPAEEPQAEDQPEQAPQDQPEEKKE